MRSSQLNMLLILLLIIWIMTSLVCTYLLIERVKALTEENRTLTESVTRLENAKTHLVKGVKQLAKEIDDLTRVRSNLLSTIQELRDKIAQFTDENTALFTTNTSFYKKIESLTESVTTLESEKTTLVDRTEFLNTENGELQQVQAMHEWMIHQLRYVNTGLIERIETLQNHTMHQDAHISWLCLACDNQLVEEDSIGYRMAEAVLSSSQVLIS